VLLDRLDELATVAEAIAGGSFDRRAATHYPDELGAVARQLNAVLDLEQQIQNAMEGRTALYRDLLIGLLGALPRPAAVIGLDGRLLASTLDADNNDEIESAGARLSGIERDLGEASIEVGNGTLQLRLLCVQAGRPLAWLATQPG
jgi:methyl-accepting chemotaxis protein